MNTQNNSVLRGTLVFVCLLTMAIMLSFPYIADAVTLYEQHNLVSDISGVADYLDSNLVNPWGIASSSTSPFWISDNKTGLSTLYNGTGQPFPVTNPPGPLVITIPGGTPTGVVFNGIGTAFNGDLFLFASEDGTISGWRGALGTSAEVLQSPDPANIYKGITAATIGTNTYLYAANFRNGTIDVLKGNASAPALTGNFTDPNLPAGYAPFNIQNIAGELYVTYALQDASKQDAVPGAGNGIVDVYDTNGTLLKRLVSGGYLNAPWGLALAPAMFGDFSNDLLIGNFGDGSINAFDPLTGNFIGQMLDSMGNPLTIEGLWGLIIGNGGNGGDVNTLYFTAGISGGDSIKDHGLFGSLQPKSGGYSWSIDKWADQSTLTLSTGQQFSVTYSVKLDATGTDTTDECIDVDDTYAGTLGTVCANDAPKTFTYSRMIGPFDVCGEYTVENTASFITDDTGAMGSDSWTLTVTLPCGGCTLTQGYWKTHSEFGPAPYDDTWAMLLSGASTPFFASGQSAYAVLRTPSTSGNAYYVLAHQYIAALLNILNGASRTPEVDNALAWAQTFFYTYTPYSKLSKTVRNKAITYASLFDQYNNGFIGPGHCSE